MSEEQDHLIPTSAEYLPKASRSGIALCLSGGGYRAALFQLGALRRLHELKVMSQVDDVSSVSGGSILAAFLAMKLSSLDAGVIHNYESDIAIPFRAFTKSNIRTGPALRRLLPWQWFNGGAQAEGLQARYERLLVPGKKIRDLPDRPYFHFCTSDMTFGVNWVFTKEKAGSYRAGRMNADRTGAIPLAQAVAASSCFPPVFKPMPMHLDPSWMIGGIMKPGPQRDACIRSIALTDGGVYDNMGLEPVWKSCQTLLVCDGGKPFRFSKSSDLPHQLLRINDVMGNQAEAVRKRWLMASYAQGVYAGTYWGIAGSVGKYQVANAVGYSEALVTEVIATIRTDMDRFSEAEAGVLENHGYSLADAALQKHAPQLHNAAPFFAPAPSLWPSAQTPNVEDKIRILLSDSSTFRPCGH